VSGFLKAAAIVMSGGAIVGAGVLAMLPEEPAAILSEPARLPKLSPAPCNRPLWPHTEGACETWPLPHRDVEGLLTSEPERAAASHGSTPESGTARRHAARADKADNTKSRRAREDNATRRVPAAPRTVTQGWGMNWPTWHQDTWPTWHQDTFHPAYAERQNRKQNRNMTGSFAFFGGPAR